MHREQPISNIHNGCRHYHATVYTLLSRSTGSNINQAFNNKIIFKEDSTLQRFLSDEKPEKAVLTTRQKFKKAVTEYGTTVVVFHVTISLMSLGICYFLISNGVDISTYVTWMGFSEQTSNKLASNAGTFVAAYAVHKIFAPVRMSITIGATPFIVRYLRNKGFLKKNVKS